MGRYDKENNKAITLIALVITIILLIILAGISLNLIFGQEGIIQRAKEQKEIQIKAEILQELELAKGQVMVDGNGYTNLEKYLQYIETHGLNSYELTKKEEINEVTYRLTIDGKYLYTATQIENNVIINEIGNIEKLRPQILSFSVIDTTTSSIKVEIISKGSEKYQFYIKKSSESDYGNAIQEIEETNIESSNSQIKTYQYENLIHGETYDIKVIAENSIDVDEKEILETTLEMIPIPKITIEEPDKWTNETKKITIRETDGYTIRYTTNRTVPSIVNGAVYNGEFTVDQNCVITAAYFDSSNQMGEADVNTVSKIDNLPPTGNISITSTTNSITVTVHAQDQDATNASGKSEIKGYYYSKEGESNYSEITTDTTRTFENLLQTVHYPIKVKVVDYAGNETELEDVGTTTTIPIPKITVADANTWTKETKTVTISKANGYTIKYTTNGTVPSKTNGTVYTAPFKVNSNCTITAVYLDNTNQVGAGATNKITKIDKSAPTVPTVNYLGGSNTCSWKNNYRLSIVSNDSQSGVAYYEVDWTGDGNANGTVASDFTPQNGYNSHNNRFRAVDRVGNKSGWTGSHHIHMDTQAPSTPSIEITNITMNSGSWSYTISTNSSDNVGITYTYRDGYDGQVFATTTNNRHTISGNSWFAYGHICVKAEDPAGNSSWSSSVYLNTRRLYIRQLYYALRENNIVSETEVNIWDIDKGLAKGADIAAGVFKSSEANILFNNRGAGVFAERMYRGILGRQADASGKATIVNLLSGGANDNAINVLVNSAEAQTIYSNYGVGAGIR